MPRDIAPRPARAPLSDIYAGTCSAGAQVDLSAIIEICNFGYARGRCAGFPPGMAWDAFRFSAPRDSFGDVIEVVWVAEKDYSPADHGRVRCSRPRRELLDDVSDPVLRQQVLAFVASYAGA